VNWYQWAQSWIQWLIGEDKSIERRLAVLEAWKKLFDPVRLKIVPCTTGPFLWSVCMDTLQLTDIQTCPVTVQEVDARGNPTSAPLDAPPVWATSDSTIITVAPDPADTTGLSQIITAVGKLGTAQLNVTGVVGGKSLAGSLQVTVVASAAATLNIVPGTPVG
jgi:hypothetical protein